MCTEDCICTAGISKEATTTTYISSVRRFAAPKFETPTNRLREAGPAALALTELLAVIIGGPNAEEAARRLGEKCDTPTDLIRISLTELEQIYGIGQASAARIQAAIALGHRLQVVPIDRQTVSSPADAAGLVMHEMGTLQQEVVKVILHDVRNRVIAIVEIYKGSLNTSMIRVGELFHQAIRRQAASIIIVHNHPSGDPSPSPEDVAVTRMIDEAGKLLDIAVHDHIIFGYNRFVSLKERGLGFG